MRCFDYVQLNSTLLLPVFKYIAAVKFAASFSLQFP